MTGFISSFVIDRRRVFLLCKLNTGQAQREMEQRARTLCARGLKTRRRKEPRFRRGLVISQNVGHLKCYMWILPQSPSSRSIISRSHLAHPMDFSSISLQPEIWLLHWSNHSLGAAAPLAGGVSLEKQECLRKPKAFSLKHLPHWASPIKLLFKEQ